MDDEWCDELDLILKISHYGDIYHPHGPTLPTVLPKAADRTLVKAVISHDVLRAAAALRAGADPRRRAEDGRTLLVRALEDPAWMSGAVAACLLVAGARLRDDPEAFALLMKMPNDSDNFLAVSAAAKKEFNLLVEAASGMPGVRIPEPFRCTGCDEYIFDPLGKSLACYVCDWAYCPICLDPTTERDSCRHIVSMLSDEQYQLQLDFNDGDVDCLETSFKPEIYLHDIEDEDLDYESFWAYLQEMSGGLVLSTKVYGGPGYMTYVWSPDPKEAISFLRRVLSPC